MWLQYFEQYADSKLPDFLKATPWNYKNDLCMIGLNMIANATGSDKWNQYITKNSNYLMRDDGSVVNWHDNEKNLDKVSFGKTLRILYNLTSEEKYQEGVKNAYRMLDDYPRTATGNFWHKEIYPNQVWLDGLYMVMPFYAQSLVEFNEDHWDDIFDQFNNADKLLWNDEKKLHIHGADCSKKMDWADKTTGKSEAVWSRAVGWLFMSLVDTYEIAKNQTERAEELLHILDKTSEHIIGHIDHSSNMFLQVVDEKDLKGNYPETSGSAMISYSFMKGERLGILPEEYGILGSKIIDGIKERYLSVRNDNIELNGICASAGLGPGPDKHNRKDRDGTPEYYLREKQMTDNQHGAAICMMAVSEQILRERFD